MTDEVKLCEACEACEVASPRFAAGIRGMLCRGCLKMREQLWRPTEAIPGTDEKLRVMIARHAHHLPLFHPDDVRFYRDETGELVTAIRVAKEVRRELRMKDYDAPIRFSQEDLEPVSS